MNTFPNHLTKICISISKKPGTSGSIFHNTAYKLLNLNYLYIPMKLNNINQIKTILKKFNIRGCSVSMPFKQEILKLLDKKDPSTILTNAANTLVLENGKIKGYNTDFFAIKRIMKKINLKKNDSILLLGNGGVSRTIYEHVKKMNLKIIYICARDIKKFKNWKIIRNTKIIDWKKRNNIYSNLLINATPIGMDNNLIPINKNKIKNFKKILDLVINKNSAFKKIVKKKNIKFYDGLEFSFYQACKQFEIYTKKKVNEKLMKKFLNYKF
jgi:shikimate dehydrogenase